MSKIGRRGVISHVMVGVGMAVVAIMVWLEYEGIGERGYGTLQVAGLALGVLLALGGVVVVGASWAVVRSALGMGVLLVVGGAIYWVASGGLRQLQFERRQAQVQLEAGGEMIQPARLGIRLTPYAEGFVQPTAIVFGAGGEMYVVERDGLIQRVENGVVSDEPFLDIQDRVGTDMKERGLLGLAFDPANESVFYVYYTDKAGAVTLSRFGSDDGRGDADSEQVLLRIEKEYRAHNGGHIEFGADGYLYLGTGDDGLNHWNAQDGSTLLGKLLRIDVSGEGSYTIPADNPFVGDDGIRDEIWAMGLRNPWRFTFDAETGDLFVADVGEQSYEELNHLSAPEGGENFGWPVWEGWNCDQECGDGAYTPPVMVYPTRQGCAITGGYVYRGDEMESLIGSFFFADYCNNHIWALKPLDSGAYEIRARRMEIDTMATFGQDADGELYVASHSSGVVYRIGE